MSWTETLLQVDSTETPTPTPTEAIDAVGADGVNAILILAILAVLAYVSVQYKYMQNGLPVFLLGVSISGVVLWELDIVSANTMFVVFGVHALGMGAIVVLEEAL